MGMATEAHGMATEVECVFELHASSTAEDTAAALDGINSSAAFSKALESSGLAEAVQILKTD